MSDKFTLRDFLVYFTTGTMTIVSFCIIFFNETLREITDFFEKYSFINDFSGLLIILAVPVIYFIGHIILGLDYLSLIAYKSIHRKLTTCRWRKWKIVEQIREFLHFIMYKNKITNSIIQINKKNKIWESNEDFWIDCAKLQTEGKYKPAEYWHTLNDLFKGLCIIFLFSSIIAFKIHKTWIGWFFLGLFLICHFRAIQFANDFVKTVRRLAQNT